MTKILCEEAKKVFEEWYNSSAKELRLLGFGVSGLAGEGGGQGLLFSDSNEKKEKKIDQVYDEIKKKYGHDSLKRGD